MHLEPFELHRPTSLGEALDLARQYAGSFDYLAGGTDLLPNYKMHLNLKPHLIALEAVPELAARGPDRLGAMVRLGDLDRDPEFRAAYPGVAEAVHEVATPLVRESGTVGGNLLVETRCFFFNQSLFWRQSLGYCLKAAGDRCHVVPQKTTCYATFSGDLAPALLALDASVDLAGPEGRRTIPLGSLYDPRGDGIQRTTLRPAELLVAVTLPRAARGAAASYRKLRVRPSFDFPELGIAAAVWLQDGEVGSLRLAAGGLETYPRRFDEVTDGYAGRRLEAADVASIADRVQTMVRPVHNTFLPPDYRRRMVSVYVRRAIAAASGRTEVAA